MGHSEKDIKLSVYARTDAGQRSGNEDAFLVADLTSGSVGLGPDVSTHQIGERGSLMVVSDGMGGAAAGEIASEMAVKVVWEDLMKLRPKLNIPEQLRKSVEKANERILDYANQDPKLKGMGATLTAVLVHQTTAYVAHVGDSRAYLLRGDKVKQLTKDQSLVQALLEAGSVRPDEAEAMPRNVIMQALGTNPQVKVELTSVELCDGDFVVLCSDGLSNKVAQDDMRRIIQGEQPLMDACRSLVELANERGGEDNITIIVAGFDGDALHSAAQSNSITGSMTQLSPPYFEKVLSELGGKAAPVKDKPAAEVTEIPANLVLRSPAPTREGKQAGRNNLVQILSVIGLLILLLAAVWYLVQSKAQ